MCLQCDGYSFEQTMLDLDLRVRVHGWAYQQVESHVPWSYTIGLLENYGCAELTMVGPRPDAQADAVHALVAGIVANGEIGPTDVDRHGFELVEVHSDHLRDHWFGLWSAYYDGLPPDGTFLQVIPPSCWFCECHRDSVPRLDRPGRAHSANRAARRRRR